MQYDVIVNLIVNAAHLCELLHVNFESEEQKSLGNTCMYVAWQFTSSGARPINHWANKLADIKLLQIDLHWSTYISQKVISALQKY